MYSVFFLGNSTYIAQHTNNQLTQKFDIQLRPNKITCSFLPVLHMTYDMFLAGIQVTKKKKNLTQKKEEDESPTFI